MASSIEVGIASIEIETVVPEIAEQPNPRLAAGTTLVLEEPAMPDLASYYPNAQQILSSTPLPGMQEISTPEGLKERLESPKHLAFGMRRDGAGAEKQIGVAGLYHFFDSEEPLLFAYIFESGSMGKGLGLLAAGACVRLAFEKGRTSVKLRRPYHVRREGPYPTGTIPIQEMAVALGMHGVGYGSVRDGGKICAWQENEVRDTREARPLPRPLSPFMQRIYGQHHVLYNASKSTEEGGR